MPEFASFESVPESCNEARQARFSGLIKAKCSLSLKLPATCISGRQNGPEGPVPDFRTASVYGSQSMPRPAVAATLLQPVPDMTQLTAA